MQGGYQGRKIAGNTVLCLRQATTEVPRGRRDGLRIPAADRPLSKIMSVPSSSCIGFPASISRLRTTKLIPLTRPIALVPSVPSIPSIPSLTFGSICPASHSRRTFSSMQRRRTGTMEVELTAPNGIKWVQPLGLFINNEFVPSSNGEKITTVNPAYVFQDQSPVSAG
jgi:hypothetical protein